MKIALKCWAALAAAHLSLVFLGAFGVDLTRLGSPGEWLVYYSTLTGADRGFGFFSPTVMSEPRAVFEVLTKDGKVRRYLFETSTTREEELRIGNIIGSLLKYVNDEKMRRAVTASWAGKVLALYDEATEVLVKYQLYDLPIMGEYTKGNTGKWVSIYQAKFRRTNKEDLE